ncbi:MAG: tetratricopeptide repeat protein [Anaerolineales bacterium]|nr:tetratricopeptide repeat protein [Anaerolineales bacterium]
MGREFESRLLAHMLQRDLSAELQQAEHEQIWTMLNAVKYMFRHVLLRDAAYEMQLRTRLRDLHYRAAVAGEALYAEVLPVYFGALAYHYETAYRFGRAEAHASAFDFLCRAGEQALATFEHQVAADYFSRALALTPVHDDDARFRLLLAREAAYNMQGSREAQVQDLAQLAGLSRRLGVAQQAAVALRRAGHAEVTGDYDAAALLAETAVQLGQQSGDLAVVASGHQTLGIASWRRGRLADAEAHFQRAVELAQLSGNHRHVAKCLHGLGNVAFYQWDLAAAKAYYLRALAIRRDIGDRVGEGDSLNNHGLVQWHRGDYAAAKADLVQVQAIYREVGDRHGEGMSLSNLGHVIVNQGDYAAARDYFEQSLAIRREVGDRYGEAISLNELGAVALAQGQLLLAETCYLQALTIRQELNQPHHLVEDWAGLARLQLALGDRESAGRYARQVLAYLETNPGLNGAIEPMRAFHFTWHALAALGEREAAAAVLRAAVRILQAYLDKNPEPALQALYLRQPHHWALWTAWQEGSAR